MIFFCVCNFCALYYIIIISIYYIYIVICYIIIHIFASYIVLHVSFSELAGCCISNKSLLESLVNCLLSLIPSPLKGAEMNSQIGYRSRLAGFRVGMNKSS